MQLRYTLFVTQRCLPLLPPLSLSLFPSSSFVCWASWGLCCDCFLQQVVRSFLWYLDSVSTVTGVAGVAGVVVVVVDGVGGGVVTVVGVRTGVGGIVAIVAVAVAAVALIVFALKPGLVLVSRPAL